MSNKINYTKVIKNDNTLRVYLPGNAVHIIPKEIDDENLKRSLPYKLLFFDSLNPNELKNLIYESRGVFSDTEYLLSESISTSKAVERLKILRKAYKENK